VIGADGISIEVMDPRFSRRAFYGGSVGIAALVAATLTLRNVQSSPTKILARIAVAGGRRAIQPRLSFDYPYAPFNAPSARDRSETPKKQHAGLMAQSLLLRDSDGGLRHLLFGELDPAIERLNGVDLAAAYYTKGLTSQATTDFALALQALSTVPNSAAATFNRALIFEQLTDAEAAAAEWRKYLVFDQTSGWAEEARQHLAVASRSSVSELWAAEKPFLIDAAFRGDLPRLRAVTARYPLGVRHLVELELFPAWGAAFSGRDLRKAERTLTAARNCTIVLAERGERLAYDAVREIDASPQKALLARAYVVFGHAHEAMEKTRYEDALAHAADALKLGSSSPAFVALLAGEAATARYRKYDYRGSRSLIEETRRRYANRRGDYVGLFASLDWLEGLMQLVSGDPSEALLSYDRARHAYERLGEVEYQAAQQINVAYALRYLGESEQADVHLRRALILASRAEDPRRLYATLKIAARSALDASAPAAALAFRNRFVQVARASGEPLRIIDALVSGGLILLRTGRRHEALRDIAEARRQAWTIEDEPSRERLIADTSAAEAIANKGVNDREVVRSLTDAVERMRALDMWILLAQLLLERGRAHLRLGDSNAAELDFRAGIENLEHQRGTVQSAEQRIAFFDRAEEAFVELALLLVRSGRTDQAFDVLERSRSRELLDRSSGKTLTPMSAAEIRKHLPRNTILVTHTVTKQTLITFVVSRDGVRAFEQQGGESAIRPLLEKVDAGFRSTRLPQLELRRLGALLVDRVAPVPDGRIVFVPDPLLYNVPYAALRMPDGSYLVKQQTIMIAASATLFVQNCERDLRLAGRRHPSLFAVASPQQPKGFDELPPLTRTTVEARKIAANYPDHRVVVASEGQSASLLAAGSGYDVLHFGTHGVVDRRVPARSALLIGESGRLTAAEIEAADLSRCRLVVLGGCYTGVGKSQRSEGAMSLARAFMAAGVPVVVGTIAPVDDAHAERFLTDFHRRYSRGLDAAEALRRTQIQMLNSTDRNAAEPAQWAAFEVIGGGCQRDQREREEVAQSWHSH
jgi:tetratricopeptide (TPR) repeat protein